MFQLLDDMGSGLELGCIGWPGQQNALRPLPFVRHQGKWTSCRMELTTGPPKPAADRRFLRVVSEVRTVDVRRLSIHAAGPELASAAQTRLGHGPTPNQGRRLLHPLLKRSKRQVGCATRVEAIRSSKGKSVNRNLCGASCQAGCDVAAPPRSC